MGNKIVKTSKKYISRRYWETYIDNIIESIKNDKDIIIDMFMYGHIESAKITMNISENEAPTYTINISKYSEESPFGEEEYE